VLHVACAADAAYIPYCATTLRGVLRQNRGVVVHLLYGSADSSDELARLADMVQSLNGELRVHAVIDSRIQDLPTLSHISGVTWYRILLPDLISVDRAIYLDCDTFVTADLMPLWELDLRGQYVAAVDSVPDPGATRWRQELGIPDSMQYFNAGVLVLNLGAMRADRVSDRLIKFARAHSDNARLTDQDTLNAVLAQRRLRLHPRWNCQSALFFAPRERSLEVFSTQEINEAKADPAILHFEGPADCKPWHFLSSHPWASRYREELALTPWRDMPLHGRTARNRLIAATLPRPWRVPVYAWIEQHKRRLGLPSDLERQGH
jgi:lipopolysaccharide biosynthesis glycosyltransferase